MIHFQAVVKKKKKFLKTVFILVTTLLTLTGLSSGLTALTAVQLTLFPELRAAGALTSRILFCSVENGIVKVPSARQPQVKQASLSNPQVT